MTTDQAGSVSNRTDTYTYEESDELAGAWTFTGRISGVLMHLLDTVRHEDLDLIEFVNHAPTGLVVAVLPELSHVLRESINRLGALDTAIASAIDSLLVRIAAEQDEIGKAFDSLMEKAFPETTVEVEQPETD